MESSDRMPDPAPLQEMLPDKRLTGFHERDGPGCQPPPPPPLVYNPASEC